MQITELPVRLISPGVHYLAIDGYLGRVLDAGYFGDTRVLRITIEVEGPPHHITFGFDDPDTKVQVLALGDDIGRIAGRIPNSASPVHVRQVSPTRWVNLTRKVLLDAKEVGCQDVDEMAEIFARYLDQQFEDFNAEQFLYPGLVAEDTEPCYQR